MARRSKNSRSRKKVNTMRAERAAPGKQHLGLGIFTIVSLVLSMVFSGMTISGNVIGGLNSTNVNVISTSFFFIAVLGAYSLLKKR